MKTLNTLLIAGIAGLAFASSAASASVVFLNGNNPQPGEENILFTTSQTGTTVSGTTNQSNVLVDFSTSTAQTLITSSSGQAKITTNDNGGLLTSIVVTSPGHTFGDFILDAEHSGAFTVTVTTNDGTFTDNLPGGPGSNFVTILAQAGETISSVAITSAAGFTSFDQPRISAISAAIPEPATWGMMLLGFAGLGFAFRQSRRKVSFA